MLCRLQTHTSSTLHTNVSNGYLVDCFLLLLCSQRKSPTTHTHTKVCCRCRQTNWSTWLQSCIRELVPLLLSPTDGRIIYLALSNKLCFVCFIPKRDYHKSMMGDGRPAQSIICAVVAIAHSVFIETCLCLFVSVCLSLQIVYIMFFPVTMRLLSSYQTRATIEQVAGLRRAYERFIFKTNVKR